MACGLWSLAMTQPLAQATCSSLPPVLMVRCMDSSVRFRAKANPRRASNLIPTRILRDTSKMGEVGHRTEMFGIGLQLVESVTHLVNHLIERGKSEIRQVFFA